jgi:hypothetical protein
MKYTVEMGSGTMIYTDIHGDLMSLLLFFFFGIRKVSLEWCIFHMMVQAICYKPEGHGFDYR